MRKLFYLLLALTIFSCDPNRVYEDYIDYKDRSWKINQPATFDFQISDTSKKYNLLMEVRNSLDYPYSRLFVNYSLKASDSASLSKEMIAVNLFDQKTGKPFGTSGLGDIYDHQFSVLKNYSFTKAGTYRMSFQQFMRQDTIPGILSVGFRLETVSTTH
jgi:gliding motility-associated lipoprotein GldH